MNRDWEERPLEEGCKVPSGFFNGEWPRSAIPKPTAFCCSSLLRESGLGRAGLAPVGGPHSGHLLPSLLPTVQARDNGLEWRQEVSG